MKAREGVKRPTCRSDGVVDEKAQQAGTAAIEDS